MPPLVPILLLVAAASPRSERELIYVAVGGFVESGGARAGDPARVVERLERARPRVRLIDLTAADATVHDVRNEQLRRAMAARPALVTIAIGASDVRGPSSLRSFSRDLQVVADLLHRTKATVVISTIPNARGLADHPGRAFRRRVDAFNWAIVRIARRHGFVLADVRARAGLPESSWAVTVGRAIDGALAPPSHPPRGLRGGLNAGRILVIGPRTHPRPSEDS
jgi:hypothetical protein